MMKRATVAALLVSAGAVPALAQSKSDGWSFEATPYLFAAGLNRSVTLRGVTAMGIGF